MLEREKIADSIRKNREKLRELGVESLALFGSISRGDATESSDVDLLVRLTPPITFDKFMDVRLFLEDLLNRKVDLILEDGLRERVRPFVEEDAIYVA